MYNFLYFQLTLLCGKIKIKDGVHHVISFGTGFIPPTNSENSLFIKVAIGLDIDSYHKIDISSSISILIFIECGWNLLQRDFNRREIFYFDSAEREILIDLFSNLFHRIFSLIYFFLRLKYSTWVNPWFDHFTYIDESFKLS